MTDFDQNVSIMVTWRGLRFRDGALCYEKLGLHSAHHPLPVGASIKGSLVRVAECGLVFVTLRLTLLRLWPSYRWRFRRAVRRWCRLVRQQRNMVEQIMELQKCALAEVAIAGRATERSKAAVRQLDKVMPRYRRLDDYLRNAMLARFHRKDHRRAHLR